MTRQDEQVAAVVIAALAVLGAGLVGLGWLASRSLADD